MTLKAELVSFELQFEAVGVVTIAAADSLGVHFTLQKGTINIILFENLSIQVIVVGGDVLHQVLILKGQVGNEISREFHSSGMAGSTHIKLSFLGISQNLRIIC